MSYRIDYVQKGNCMNGKAERRKRIQVMTATLFLLWCMSVRFFAPGLTNQIRAVLLPVERTATEDAFLSLVTELRSGEKIGTCVEVFCERILQNGAEDIS